MSTDASTVEDINIPQIIERLSMSCIESSIDHFLYSRMIGMLEKKSDSAAVSESTSISMTNLLDTGLPVLVPDISPDFLT